MTRKRFLRSAWLAAALLGVFWVFTFYGSAGRVGPWPVYMTYHDLLAEGFRAGHLYVPVEPDPRLLAQSDPYDPVNGRFWWIDMSLYRGKYYIYWGPVPALLQAIAKSVLGIQRLIGDQYLVFAFTSANALFGALFLDRMARRLFTGIPLGVVLAAAIGFAFANPGPYLVATGGVYQASITGGQAFLLLGLLFAFDGVWRARAGSLGALRFWGAGTAWALAIGCRISLAPAIAAMALATALIVAWPAPRRVHRLLATGACIGIPIAAAAGLLLWYNYLRFDNWLEFGTNYQLSYFKFRLDFAQYWLANAYSYVLRPLEYTCSFPFVLSNWYPPVANSLPSYLSLPKGYLINEPVAGWLRVVPLSWLSPLAVLLAARAVVALRRRPSVQVNDAQSRVARVRIWCVLCLGIAFALTGVLQMGLYMATMRYLSDVMNGLLLLSCMGGFALYSAVRERSRIAAVAVGTAIAALCIAGSGYGLLLAYRGYGDHFKTHNPALHARWVDELSLRCAERTR